MQDEKRVFDGLNPAQEEAVKQLSGPILILAGAGSGKTKTLTHRIANLIRHGVRPEEILAVTFTNKAAKEMRQRLWKLSTGEETEAPRSFMPYMGTFHGICVKILRIENVNAGLGKNFVIYDTEDQVALIRRIMKEEKITDKSIKPKSVQAIISAEKNRGNTPEDYSRGAYYPNQVKIAKIFREYEEAKAKADAVDFDDLLLITLRMFQTNREVREKWKRRFRHILVDEYQDTNHVQYQLIKLLVGEERNICVVGDDWQSIYSWRGADFTNILNFEKDFPGAKVVKLEQNYRSTGAILAASQKIINQNKQRTDKTLYTEAGEGEPIVIKKTSDENMEARWVAQKIIEMVAKGRNFQDFAILYRTNAQSFAFEKMFIQMMVPYKIIGGVRFYDRSEVKDVIAIMKLVINPRDIVSFERVAKNVLAGVGEASMRKVVSAIGATEAGENPYLRAELLASLAPKARRGIERLRRFIEKERKTLEAEEGKNPAEVVKEIVEGFDFETLLDDGTPGGRERIDNLAVLMANAEPYEEIEEFVADAALMSSADESAQKDSVTLMTLHAAKGLEFPVVFLVGMEDGLFPSARSQTEAELEEERRLAYVGMTRAMKELFLSYAQSRYSFGGRNWTSPSRFLIELGYDPYGAQEYEDGEEYGDVDGDGFIDYIPEDDLPIYE